MGVKYSLVSLVSRLMNLSLVPLALIRPFGVDGETLKNLSFITLQEYWL